MNIQIEHNIDIEIRCPYCDEVMSVTDQYKSDETHIVIRLYPCEYCEENNESKN